MFNPTRLETIFPEGRRGALTFSYDDGAATDRQLVEIFNRYQVKGTFHLCSGLFDDDVYITSAEVAELYRGHEVACHTIGHAFLERSPEGAVIRDVLEDRKKLESLCGYPVTGLSYPCNGTSPRVREILKSLGIAYARTTNATGNFTWPEDFLLWHPTCHHGDPKLFELAEDFRKFRYPAAIFYVWGHSYEFDRNHNWDLMEKFCAEMSGNSRIWYATNIEIQRYLIAARSLVTDVACRLIYNPSAQRVWLLRNLQEEFSIGPGETVEIPDKK